MSRLLAIILLLFCLNQQVFAQQSWALKPYAITLPRLTTAQQSTSAPQQAGNVIYNTDQQKIGIHNGTAWQYLSATDATTYPNEQWIGASQRWTVPAGVTRVLVEVWSAGAGGSVYLNTAGTLTATGGGGGGYVRGVVPVKPGTSLSLLVGTGGRGANRSTNATARDGGFSAVYDSVGTAYVAVFGGSALGGGGFVPVGTPRVGFTVRGSTATNATFSYEQRNSTDFVLLVNGGNGGTAFGAPPGGLGAQFAVLTSGTVVNLAGDNEGSQFGSYPGGGGGGGYNYGGPGTDGMVVIHW